MKEKINLKRRATRPEAGYIGKVTLADGEPLENVTSEILRLASQNGITEGDVGYFEDPRGISGAYRHKLMFDVYHSGQLPQWSQDTPWEDSRLTEKQRQLSRKSTVTSYMK